MTPNIWIITVIYSNTQDELSDLINSVKKMDYQNYSLLLINNGPTQPWHNSLLANIPNSQFINNPNGNTGYAGGNNVGIHHAINHGADYILLLNPDTTVKPTLLKDLLECFSKDKNIGLALPIITFPDKKKVWYAGGYTSRVWGFTRSPGINHQLPPSIQDRYVSFAPTCCALVSTRALQQTGFFDESYFLYFEDTALNFSLVKHGYKLYFHAKHLVTHNKKSTKLSPLEAYYYGRNPFILIRQHFSWPLNWTAYLGQFIIRLPRNILRVQNTKALIQYLIGIKDGILGKTGKHWPA
ncbi:MAG: N-acetylglucosaminyl-diphospho-decaprenol L-rhamnosyltransferase [bacterium ADurb.Bin400]|nr:MAG: N-acetylglucosaminyl-diphospho-decaprenol L-rhamnosyltransferase [bacterium ADurb.Bin400]